MTSAPIDILMATRDGAKYVGEQVASIQLQSYRDWRLLVSDDCSSDGTLGIVRGLEGVDPRIRIVSEDVRFGSAKANFMHLLSLSEAPYAMFCDQDDVWLPEKVERTLGRMRELEREHGQDVPLLVFADMAVVDEDLGLIAPSFERYGNLDPSRVGFSQLLAHNEGAGCAMMMNRRLVELCAIAGRHDDMVMHDWWAMLVAAAFGAIGYVDEPLALYRQHGANAVGASAYSPVSRAMNLDDMESHFQATVAQARAFGEVYVHDLDLPYARSLASYSALASVGSCLGGVRLLAASGSWKKGPRRLGQIAVVARAASESRLGRIGGYGEES